MTTSEVSFGRYELRGELGWGGFAMVYRAWDPGLRREVALKALLPHLAKDPALRRRFFAEAQALARLRHPNIVTVFDVGEAEGRPFFAMELIPGRTLAKVLGPSKSLPLGRVIELLQSLASALDELHANGLVHRDIKPQNVMLEDNGRVVLMDLGIARALDGTTLTQTGATLGTPSYMAPEQVRGERVGPPADIYALGILTYHLLAGRPPFVGDTPSVLHAQVFDPPPSLQALQPGLPEQVCTAVDAPLSKDPARRPVSARQFLQMLSVAPVAAALPSRRHDSLPEPVANSVSPRGPWAVSEGHMGFNDAATVPARKTRPLTGVRPGVAPASLAGFWRRAWAHCVDGTACFAMLMLGSTGMILLRTHGVPINPRLAWFVVYASVWGYFVIGFRTSKTLGCAWCKLAIIDERTHANATYGQALIRAIPYLTLLASRTLSFFLAGNRLEPEVIEGGLILALIGLPALGSIWLLWDAQRQTLFDKLARTVVVRR